MNQNSKNRLEKIKLSKEEKDFRELAKLPALSSKELKSAEVSKEQLNSRDILTSQLARFQLDVNRAEKYKKERAHAELYANSTGDQKREFRETQSELRRNGLDEKTLSDRRASLKEQISARSAFYERERNELASFRETLRDGSREANFYDAREAMLLKKSDKIDHYDLSQLRLSTHRYAEKLKTNERHQEVVKADARTLELQAKHSEVNTQGLFDKFKSFISKTPNDIAKEVEIIQKLAAAEAVQYKKPEQAKPLDKTIDGYKKEVVDGKKVQHVSKLDSSKIFIDHGKRIELSDAASQDKEILKASLKLASEKFKNGFTLNGSDAEKKALLKVAVELNLGKQIKNPELKEVIREAQKERFEERFLKAKTNVVQMEENKQSIYEANENKPMTERERYRELMSLAKESEDEIQAPKELEVKNDNQATKEFRETLSDVQKKSYDRQLESLSKDFPYMNHIEMDRFNKHFESTMLKQSQSLSKERDPVSKAEQEDYKKADPREQLFENLEKFASPKVKKDASTEKSLEQRFPEYFERQNAEIKPNFKGESKDFIKHVIALDVMAATCAKNGESENAERIKLQIEMEVLNQNDSEMSKLDYLNKNMDVFKKAATHDLKYKNEFSQSASDRLKGINKVKSDISYIEVRKTDFKYHELEKSKNSSSSAEQESKFIEKLTSAKEELDYKIFQLERAEERAEQEAIEFSMAEKEMDSITENLLKTEDVVAQAEVHQAVNKVESKAEEIIKDEYSFLEDINNSYQRSNESAQKSLEKEAESESKSQGGRSQGR